MVQEVRELIAARRTGAEHMLEALGRRYDFLAGDVRPPPVGPLADALAAMNDARAAPLLAARLNEPSDSTDDVRRVAKALTVLGTKAELADVRTFFSLYRATADDPNLVAAVISAAEVLLRIGGDVGRDLVRYAAKDPLTHPDVKVGLSNFSRHGG
jgi:outer membrane protein assembly factor BamB